MPSQSRSFLAGAYAINGLRKSGYKNLAYALGELVDNSIQENAMDVEILVAEHQIPTKTGSMVWRVNEIGILDNGDGMDKDRLWRCLRLGDGDTQQGNERGLESRQMGKFGVGLPQASISQCKKIDIWSWDGGGPNNALHISIDLDDDEFMENHDIPEPSPKEIPEKWLKNTDIVKDSGTLIVWSKLDRCSWRTGTAIRRNSEYLIGRMYRNHLAEDDVSICLVAFENDPPYSVRSTDRDGDGIITDDEIHAWFFKPNDPMYLNPQGDCDNPPRNPMFDPVGEPQELNFKFQDPETGEQIDSTVTLTFSKACVLVRQGHGWNGGAGRGGAQPHGLHARKNMGLSIVREGRELELDDAWCTTERNAAFERWWGAQIEFSKEMDTIFGVSNNKQHAHNLSGCAKKTWETYRDDDEETITEIKKRVEEEDYEMFVCMTVADEIKNNLGLVRKMIFAENPGKGQRGKNKEKRHDAESQATAAIEERKRQGLDGASDKDEDKSDEEKLEALEKALSDAGITPDEIEEIDVKNIVDLGHKVLYLERDMESEAFFSVEKEVGKLLIYLNKKHKAYKYLISTLDGLENDDDISEQELRFKAHQASKALKLLLSAWARIEDESKGDTLRSIVRMRRNWGMVSDDFLHDPEDKEEDWTS